MATLLSARIIAMAPQDRTMQTLRARVLIVKASPLRLPPIQGQKCIAPTMPEGASLSLVWWDYTTQEIPLGDAERAAIEDGLNANLKRRCQVVTTSAVIARITHISRKHSNRRFRYLFEPLRVIYARGKCGAYITGSQSSRQTELLAILMALLTNPSSLKRDAPKERMDEGDSKLDSSRPDLDPFGSVAHTPTSLRRL